MSRIFLSHSSLDSRQALALKQWLVGQEPPLANEIFLDIDPTAGLRPGERWKSALQHANARCEAVVCLLSANWAASRECGVEYRFAEHLNKRILCARLEPSAADDLTSEWQRCDLFGDGPTTAIDVGGGPPMEFATDGLFRLRDAIRGAGISAQSFVWPPPNDPDRAPYRGWEPFEPLDAAVFFGRDSAIIGALDELRGMRQSEVKSLFVVLGPSGAGKSSFLRAGLLPRLAREDRSFAVLGIVRPGRNPLTGDTGLATSISVARNRLGLTTPTLGAIKTACGEDPAQVRELLAEVQRAAAKRLPKYSEGESPSPPTLILPVDQAEELFGNGSDSQSARFLSVISTLVGEAAAPTIGLIVAATIRTDRYEMMQTDPALAGLNTRVFDELKPMPLNQFREVITGPADRATQAGHPLSIAPALVDRLLADASEGADALPMLSLTLARLYTDFGSSGNLTLSNYEDMGAMQKVVRNVVDDILSEDPDERQRQLWALRAAFIPWLATVASDKDQPIRRVANWSDLPEASRPLVDALVGKRLLVKDTRDGEVVVEVALESLFRQWDELAGWLNDERANLMVADSVERAAAAWEHNGCQPDWLLTGSRLTDAELLADTPGFRQRLASTLPYLGASRLAEDERWRLDEEHRQLALQTAEERARNAQEREAVAQAHSATLRRRSWITTALAVLAVIVAVVAVVAFVQARSARSEAQRRFLDATSARLVTDAQGVLTGSRQGSEVMAFHLLLAADSIAAAPAAGALYTAILQNQRLQKITEASTPVIGVAPNGDKYATVARNVVQLWDTGTGRPIGDALVGHTDFVTSVAFTPDGSRVVSGDNAGAVHVWDAGTGRPLGAPVGVPDNAVFSVAISDDGSRIASGGFNSLWAWEVGSGEPIAHPAPVGTVTNLAFSRDGSRIVSGSWELPVQVWDVATNRRVGEPILNTRQVTSVAFNPDATRVLTGSDDAKVQLWEVGTGRPLGEPLVGQTGAVTSVAFSRDGSRIVAGGGNTVWVWNAAAGRRGADPLRTRTGKVTYVGFSGEGSRIVAASDDKTVRVWDSGTGVLVGHKWAVHSVAFSPDGSRIVSGGEDATVRVWDAGTGREVGNPFVGHARPVTDVAFSADGSRIISASRDETVRLWDPVTGKPIGDPHGFSWTGRPGFSRDGSRIVSGGEHDTVQVWDIATGRQIGEPFVGHTDPVTSAVFSPDGSRIASGSSDRTVRVWDTAIDSPVTEPLTGHTDTVTSVAFSPDGSRIVSGSSDNTVRVWDAATGRPVGEPLTGHTESVTDVAFSPDGSRIVSGSQDGSLRLWDANTGRPIGEPLTGHTESVTGVAFSPDGSHVVSSSTDDSVRLWPAVARAKDLCDKLTVNMSRKQWNEWVTPDIPYIQACPGLPVPD